MNKKIHTIKTILVKHKVLCGVIVLTIGLFFTISVLSQQSNLASKAAGAATLEAENGIRTGITTLVNDTNASGGKYLTLGTVGTATFDAENGISSGAVTLVNDANASGGKYLRFGTTITNRPAQPGAVIYGDFFDPAKARPYAQPGAMVIAGRTNYNDQVFKDISASGGTVLMYVDALINSGTDRHGRYMALLLNDSECGPAVPNWPGDVRANQWGYILDIRVGGILQNKLECVLETMVQETPHMGGFFADDLGPRVYGFDVSTWSGQPEYRAGAIELMKTFRKVADRHGLIVIVNGSWDASDPYAGGYPDRTKHGNALADGGMVEHHDAQSQLSFFAPYACSSQWASQSPVTNGKAIMFDVSNTATDRDLYSQSGCYAYTTAQNNNEYYDGPTPWSAFHASGLPNKVQP